MSAFGILLRSSRHERGLSREEVAALLGVSAATIGTWERGGGIPTRRVRQVVPRLVCGLQLSEVVVVDALNRSAFEMGPRYRHYSGCLVEGWGKGLDIERYLERGRCADCSVPVYYTAVRCRPCEYQRRVREVCLRGHPLYGDNLYTSPAGNRVCRSCRLYVAQLRQRYCVECKSPISSKSSGRCRKCSNRTRKLKSGDVTMIRALYESGLSQQEIANRYSVSRRTVGSVINGETWHNA